MYWFTADAHYGHANIIKYCNRPFIDVHHMNRVIRNNFNSVVKNNDITVHIGDFCWAHNKKEAEKYIRRLNGNHIFVKGSHDSWLPNTSPYMWRKMIEGQFIVCCHYAMRTWERAYHGSWQLYGHSHGRLDGIGKQYDVGVDKNNFYPVSFEQISIILGEWMYGGYI